MVLLGGIFALRAWLSDMPPAPRIRLVMYALLELWALSVAAWAAGVFPGMPVMALSWPVVAALPIILFRSLFRIERFVTGLFQRR